MSENKQRQLRLYLAETPAGVSEEVRGAFDRFWAAYPRRVEKKRAIREWERLRPDAPLANRIIQAALQYAMATDREFVQHPDKWLRGARWEDEDGPPAQPICAFCMHASDHMVSNEFRAIYICRTCAQDALDMMGEGPEK